MNFIFSGNPKQLIFTKSVDDIVGAIHEPVVVNEYTEQLLAAPQAFLGTIFQ